MKKRKFVVGVKEGRNGTTVMAGKPLGEFRAYDFADHALPQLANKVRKPCSDLGIFLDGKLVHKESGVTTE